MPPGTETVQGAAGVGNLDKLIQNLSNADRYLPHYVLLPGLLFSQWLYCHVDLCHTYVDRREENTIPFLWPVAWSRKPVVNAINKSQIDNSSRTTTSFGRFLCLLQSEYHDQRGSLNVNSARRLGCGKGGSYPSNNKGRTPMKKLVEETLAMNAGGGLGGRRDIVMAVNIVAVRT